MKKTNLFSGSWFYFFVFFVVLLGIFLMTDNVFRLPQVFIFSIDTLNQLLVVLVAILVWGVSPVGGLWLVFYKKRIKSVLMKKMQEMCRFFAVLTWMSFMMIMLLVHIDHIYWQMFNLGSDVLYLALYSGFIVGGLMVLITGREKWLRLNQVSLVETNLMNNFIEGEVVGVHKNVYNNSDNLKDRVKNKIKTGLKEIVNDEIDRRF